MAKKKAKKKVAKRKTAKKKSAKKKSPNYWVTPGDDGGWDVKREGASRASNHFKTQSEANARARQLAMKSKGERITLGKNGKIKSKDSYGNDPRGSKG